MPSATLTPTTARSGYLRKQTGGSVTATIPNATAQCGVDRGDPNYTYRGFIAFDASSIRADATVTSATLTIPTATSDGSASMWTIHIYTGATIDLDDLDATYESGTDAWTTSGPPPLSVEAEIGASYLDDLITGDEAAIRLDAIVGPSDVYALWLPTIATAELVITYAYRAVDLSSSVATSASKTADIGQTVTSSTEMGNVVTGTSTLATSCDALASSLRRTVSLTSTLPGREA